MTPFVLDKAAILDRLGGDEDILAMMVDLFLQDVDNNCNALLAAVGGEQSELQREAHTIKALLATFSDDAGAELAHVLECRAKTGQLDGASDLAGELLTRVAEVAEVLRSLSAG